MAGDQQLRTGDHLDRIVSGQGADITELLFRIVRIAEKERETGLFAFAVEIGLEVFIVGSEQGVDMAVAALCGEFDAEAGGLGQRDLHDENLKQDLSGNDIKFIDQSLDGGIGSWGCPDDEAVEHAVGEDADRGVENAGVDIGLCRLGFDSGVPVLGGLAGVRFRWVILELMVSVLVFPVVVSMVMLAPWVS